MEIVKMPQNIPEYAHYHQKTERNNSKSLLMEYINNTKSNFENKINSIISFLQNMKKENDQNLEQSKNNYIINQLIFYYL